MARGAFHRTGLAALLLALFGAGAATLAPAAVDLKPADTVPGYVALLLINESPFPGERGWLSEADSKATMLSILWVLESRIGHVPPGYRQVQIAAVQSDDVIDIITVGGKKGQCDGFYRDGGGQFVAEGRVHDRVENLTGIAQEGAPGKFARLLNYAQGLADAYVKGGIAEADRFAGIKRVGSTDVTGRAYSWMSDMDYYNPGGNFIKIPNEKQGSLGGNRFFTLKQL